MENSKKNLQKVILIGTLALIFVIGAVFTFFWLKFDDLEKEVKTSQTETEKIDPALSEFLRKSDINTIPYEAAEVGWGKAYNVVQAARFDQLNLPVTYDAAMNEKLQLPNRLADKNLKGLAVVEDYVKKVGSYYTNSVIVDGYKTKDAMQRNYVVHYLDLNSQKIIKRDTLYGTLPDKNISSTASGVGEVPSQEDLSTLIRTTVK